MKSTRTRPGNPYLKGALGTAAIAAGRSKDTFLGARYRHLSARIGKSKATVATEHTILVATWNMAHTGALYDDPGADHNTRLHPDRARKRAIRQLEAMGYTVTLDRAGRSKSLPNEETFDSVTI